MSLCQHTLVLMGVFYFGTQINADLQDIKKEIQY